MNLPSTRITQKRILKTPLPGPASQELTARRAQAVTTAIASVLPIWAADADGGIILDVDGNSVIDLGSGIAVTTVGASNPAVIAAVSEAVAHFTHTCFMVTPYEGYLRLAEKLNSITPGTFAKRTILANTGSEAVENAVKIARVATGKPAIVVLDHAYHGRTNLTMAMTAKAAPYKAGFGPFASEIYRVPGSYPLRDGLDGKSAAENTISFIERQIGAGQVAAIVAEPIQGEGGFIEPASGFLSGLTEWTRSNGVLFIADEVQSGIARSGDWFASGYENIEPDLVAIAKGVGGGLPIGAVTGRAEVLDAVHPGGLGGTYGGNPVACAAALAALEQIESFKLVERARHLEQIIRSELGPTLELPQVAEIRGRGAMIAVEFVESDGVTPAAGLTKAIAAKAFSEGVLVLTTGSYGNVIRLLPPLVISDDLLRDGLRVLRNAIETVTV